MTEKFLGNIKGPKGDKGDKGDYASVDSELSSTSTNPVQNNKITEALNTKAEEEHTHTKNQITDFTHNHDDRYYTELEIDTKIEEKANSIHSHTTSEITDLQTELNNKANSTHNHEISDINNLQTNLNTLQGAIDSIVSFEAVEVSSLPTTGQNGIIYLVPKTGTGNDVHDEYVWVPTTNKFEKVGNTEVNLTNYYNKTEVNNLFKADAEIASTSRNGLMSKSDKTKLNGMTTIPMTITFTDGTSSTYNIYKG